MNNPEIKRHERYKKYVMYSYNMNTIPPSTKSSVLNKYTNPQTGFYGYTIKDENHVVIVYKGTDFDNVRDAKNDMNMAVLKKIPEQVTDALKLYDIVKTSYPNTKIDVTGHSLGGSLAQYVAIMRNVNEAVCFCPVGITKSIKNYINQYGCKTPANKVINYNNPNDIWTKYYTYDLYGIKYKIENIHQKTNSHKLEDMSPLYTRKQVFNDNYKSDINSTTKNNDICKGTYHVNGYTRNDGVHVRDYMRTCGAKHHTMSEAERLAGQAKYKNKRMQDIPDDELEEAISYFI